MSDNFDINSLLDANLDDLADLPTFEAFPEGVHDVKVTMSLKDINGKQLVDVSFEHVAVVELAHPETDKAPEPGSKCNILCQLDNPYGQGTFKMFCKVSGEVNGIEGASNRQKMEACNATLMRIVSGIRVNKDTKAKYLQVKEVLAAQ